MPRSRWRQINAWGCISHIDRWSKDGGKRMSCSRLLTDGNTVCLRLRGLLRHEHRQSICNFSILNKSWWYKHYLLLYRNQFLFSFILLVICRINFWFLSTRHLFFDEYDMMSIDSILHPSKSIASVSKGYTCYVERAILFFKDTKPFLLTRPFHAEKRSDPVSEL